MANLSVSENISACPGHPGGAEREPMHPDDFAAHLAWITAKRFHENGTEKMYNEKPVYFRIAGGQT
jgi:hypothetical protein